MSEDDKIMCAKALEIMRKAGIISAEMYIDIYDDLMWWGKKRTIGMMVPQQKMSTTDVRKEDLDNPERMRIVNDIY